MGYRSGLRWDGEVESDVQRWMRDKLVEQLANIVLI